MIQTFSLHSKGEGIEKQKKILREIYGNIPVKDADANLRICSNGDDIKNAIPRDTRHCVFANACHRLYDSTHVVFFRTVAYVDMLDENGDRIIFRFVLSPVMADAIVEFDKTHKARPGGYTLYAPSPSRQLEVTRLRAQEQRKKHSERINKQKRDSAERHRKAKIKGTLREEGFGKTLTSAGLFVRSGTGLAQFTKRSVRES